jgi:hypothetical protein
MPQIVHSTEGSNLADVLERILDKGVVIAGDIRIRLVEVELLTISIRLLISSVDRAREMGIDWWSHSAFLSSGAPGELTAGDIRPIDVELRDLRNRVDRLERTS